MYVFLSSWFVPVCLSCLCVSVCRSCVCVCVSLCVSVCVSVVCVCVCVCFYGVCVCLSCLWVHLENARLGDVVAEREVQVLQPAGCGPVHQAHRLLYHSA